ncbi:MAG: hypothetical protein N3A53_07235 [Verrucomicrobiae bacterium]|nr:hypothetical protein [Verrucomicrobiae bacterium]
MSFWERLSAVSALWALATVAGALVASVFLWLAAPRTPAWPLVLWLGWISLVTYVCIELLF